MGLFSLRFSSATVIGGIINSQNPPLFSACVDGGLLTPLISPHPISASVRSVPVDTHNLPSLYQPL